MIAGMCVWIIDASCMWHACLLLSFVVHAAVVYLFWIVWNEIEE